jgi:hypothetical protein
LTASQAGDLNAPADPVSQQIQPGQRVVHLEPAPDHVNDLMTAAEEATGGRASLQIARLDQAELAAGIAWLFRGKHLSATGGQRPPPAVR